MCTFWADRSRATEKKRSLVASKGFTALGKDDLVNNGFKPSFTTCRRYITNAFLGRIEFGRSCRKKRFQRKWCPTWATRCDQLAQAFQWSETALCALGARRLTAVNREAARATVLQSNPTLGPLSLEGRSALRVGGEACRYSYLSQIQETRLGKQMPSLRLLRPADNAAYWRSILLCQEL